jgi:hypothetical protein
MGDLEAREYSSQDVVMIRLIWKYLKQGFKHKAAYRKALAEFNSEKTA